MGTLTAYIYDAEGNRVAKGTPSSLTCSLSSISVTTRYIVGINGEQLSEENGAGTWVHTNVFAGGKLLATYEPNQTYFAMTDWLGTKRGVVAADGTQLSTDFSLPYGNQLSTSGSAPDASEHHFTGKERDAETGFANGNDYFGARYYASSMGRFMSPDWSAQVEPIPYAKLDNPQSLNLYAYVFNNPMVLLDADGHAPFSWGGFEDCSERGDCGNQVQFTTNLAQAQAQAVNASLQAQQQMTTSAAGVAFIEGWEGWNGTVDKKTGLTFAKDDGFGNGTIGWGHNCGKCTDFKNGITKEQGESLLKSDLAGFEKSVNGLGASLSQQQFDGLVSFAFNVRNYGSSTLFGNVSSGTAVTEANFTAYGHARVGGRLVEVPSLMTRRRSEYNIYANGVYDSSH